MWQKFKNLRTTILKIKFFGGGGFWILRVQENFSSNTTAHDTISTNPIICTRDVAKLWTWRSFALHGGQFELQISFAFLKTITRRNGQSIEEMWKISQKSSLVLFSKLTLIRN